MRLYGTLGLHAFAFHVVGFNRGSLPLRNQTCIAYTDTGEEGQEGRAVL